MAVAAIRKMPSAAAVVLRCSGLAMLAIACLAASGSSRISPPRKRAAERLRADDSSRRPRLQHPDAVVAGLIGLVEAAGRLHDQERAVESGAADVIVDLADIAANLGADIGIGGDRRAALELAIFL